MTQPLSKFLLKAVSKSEREDKDYPGVSDLMLKGNFVIPWRGAKKERENKTATWALMWSEEIHPHSVSL